MIKKKVAEKQEEKKVLITKYMCTMQLFSGKTKLLTSKD
jgi:hypothetical protein